MKLFQSPTSPYVRKVRVMIREKGLGGIEEIAVNPWDDPPDSCAPPALWAKCQHWSSTMAPFSTTARSSASIWTVSAVGRA